jgi:hypothetical protein
MESDMLVGRFEADGFINDWGMESGIWPRKCEAESFIKDGRFVNSEK